MNVTRRIGPLEAAIVIAAAVTVVLLATAGYLRSSTLEKNQEWQQITSGIQQALLRGQPADLDRSWRSCRNLLSESGVAPIEARQPRAAAKELCDVLEGMLEGEPSPSETRRAERLLAQLDAQLEDELIATRRSFQRLDLIVGAALVVLIAATGWFARTRARDVEQLAARTAGIIHSAAEGILELDTGGIITLANPAAATMLHTSSDRLVGRRLVELLRHDGRTHDSGECPVSSGVGGSTSHELLAIDDSEVEVELTMAPTAQEEHGHAAVVVFRDIGAQVEAARVRDEFLATVSHELRTPLTSIRGYLELLDAEVTDSDQARSHVEVAVRNARRLELLVADLLFVAQVEARELELLRSSNDLVTLVRQAVESAAPAAAARGIGLHSELPATMPAMVDADRVSQMLDNVISNAIKFSHEGGTVELHLHEQDAHAVITVCDSGPGIPVAELERVFERFHRTASASARAISGTGLGLAIVRSIAEAHGGSAHAENRPGGGARVVLRIPLTD